VADHSAVSPEQAADRLAIRELIPPRCSRLDGALHRERALAKSWSASSLLTASNGCVGLLAGALELRTAG
jgi:hypothetical protein